MDAKSPWERLTSSAKWAVRIAVGFARQQGRPAGAPDLLFGVSQEHGESSPPLELLRFFNIPEQALYESLRASPLEQSTQTSFASEVGPEEDPLASGRVGEAAVQILSVGMQLAEKFNRRDQPPMLRLHDLFGALLLVESDAGFALRRILGPARIDFAQLTSAYQDFLQVAHETTLPRFLAGRFPRPSGPGAAPNAPPSPGAELTSPGGLHVTVTENSLGWLLPVEGLVVAPFASFYTALEKALPPETARLLRSTLDQHRPQELDATHPVAVRLEPTLGKAVLPNSPPDKAFIIMTIARTAPGRRSAAIAIRPAVRAVLKLADEQGLRSLAIPLIGSQGGTRPSVQVAQRMLDELTAPAAYTNLKQVHVITLRPEVVELARNYQPAGGAVPPPGTPPTPAAVLARSQQLYNDRPEGADLLDIREEVEALADTLLLRDVRPPIAVGVLGGWGSGKSFILHLISARMAEHRTWKISKGYADDGKTGTVSDYVGHIYQITFNAWTYAKSNLWASLMQTIFFELNRQLSLEKLFASVSSLKEGGTLYRLLYNEAVAADRGLPSLLKEKGALTEADLKEIQGHDSQVLWETLRKRRAAYLEALARAEADLAQASAGLTEEARRLEEKANAELAGEDRRAGLYAIASLTLNLVEGALGREVRQHLMIQTMDRRVVEDVRAIMTRRSTDDQKKAQLKDKGVDDEHARRLLTEWPAPAAVPAEAEKVESAAIREVLKSQKLTDEDVKQALEALPSLRATGLRLWQTAWKNRWVSLLLAGVFLLIFFGLPPLLAFLFGEPGWSRTLFLRVTGAVTALIPVVWPIVRTALGWNKQVGEALDAYEAAQARGREAWAKRREDWLARRTGAEKEAVSKIVENDDTPQAKLKALGQLADKGNLAARENQVSLLKTQTEELRRKTGPTSQYASLLDFVRARLDAQYYESRLGLMHQVKQDLDELTDGLTIDSLLDDPATIKAKQALFPRGPARVVLFIDDLDRCPPPRVVEVLEAVQLLLCTRLFVVILGLDTRYITLALEKEYKDILRHEGDPSGMDYIEKIIQIPYGVRPMAAGGLEKYLKAQMKVEETADKAGPAGGGTGGGPAGDDTGGGPAGDDTGGGPAGDDTGGGSAGGGAAVHPSPPRPLESEIESLLAGTEPPSKSQVVEQRFTQADLEDVLACERLVKLTPRAVRRLVNVLKLLKVYWARTNQALGRPVTQTAVSLLALSAAYPEIMREAFVQMDVHFRNPAAPTYGTAEFLVNLSWQKSVEEAFAWQLSRFRADISRLSEKGLCQATLEALGETNFSLVRSFSFVGDPSYWTAPGRAPQAPTK